MRTYSVKEIHLTLQGEGAQSGRVAIFLRFSGCNLWSGREVDRATAQCRFCDTDFVGTDGMRGGKYSASDLVETLIQLWQTEAGTGGTPYVVCTGGEPLLQLDSMLIDMLKSQGFEIGVETNGTIALPPGLDWVCVSPKPHSDLIVQAGNELKFIYPQNDKGASLDPADFAGLAFDHFFIQPMDNSDLQNNVAQAIAFCRANPQWRLSVQTHKSLGIP